MRIALYARVSTEDQKADMQLRELRRYAAARKLEVVGEFIDEDETGKKSNRPQLNRLMEAARKRRFDMVLVWKFDRWARSVSHASRTLDEFRTLGIEFVSFTENFDTTSPMGAAMFAVAAAFAQLEGDLISERTKAALKAAKESGTVLGAKPLARQAEVLQLRNSGASFREISSKLGVSVGYAHSAVKATKVARV